MGKKYIKIIINIIYIYMYIIYYCIYYIMKNFIIFFYFLTHVKFCISNKKNTLLDLQGRIKNKIKLLYPIDTIKNLSKHDKIKYIYFIL